MRIVKGETWGLIPARGGSKSIPLKNLAAFAGRPLIDHVVLAAQASGRASRLICSTDSPEIKARCRELGVEPHDRPAELGQDETPVIDVIAHLLRDLAARDGAVAEFIALLQPTSPFLLPAHIDAAVDALVADREAGSAQTVVPCPHNHHAVNQRIIADGHVAFRFADDRAQAYNKQRKAPHFLFGNLLVFRAEAALAQHAPFATPSLPVEIPFHYGFDLDGPDDIRFGEALLAAGLVALPHLA